MTTNIPDINSIIRQLGGLHADRVALITGGSVGIGAAIARLLALSGARVMVAARSAGPLHTLREALIAELSAAGYPDAAERVVIEADCDVGRPADMARLAERALATFGHVDYLINNAGVVGPEDMVIDMPIDGWRQTLQANMNSNYALLRRLAPQMKQRGYGHVINVSSYFGGEKYVAIAYPNRADYAVSKAGQRAMVESFARFFGPEIQLNAIAPGPVDGDRLRGTADRPSMFQRRARVILENKRLGDIYAALLHAQRASGQPISDLLGMVLANDVAATLADHTQPEALRRLAQTINSQSDPQGPSQRFFLNQRIATKLLARLVNGGSIGQLTTTEWHFDSVPDPFFTQAEFEREGNKVGQRIVGMMHLRRIPTNEDVALAAVFHLADHYVTGETFHSTGGLRFERAVTEGELFGYASPERLAKLRGATFYLVGEAMAEHLTRLARALLDNYGLGRVVLLSETAEAAEALLAALPVHTLAGRLVALPTNGDLEGGFDQARTLFGAPDAVVCTPFHGLPRTRLAATPTGDWSEVLSEVGFVELVEQQLTHHVRIAKKVAAIDGVRLALVTPPTSAASSDEEFALANFVKTTLHSFTATFGAESERLIHYGAVNQVDLTRRARDEEPRSAAEEEEELTRFVEAIVLTCAPLPSPKESRYRARIYRGNAITV